LVGDYILDIVLGGPENLALVFLSNYSAHELLLTFLSLEELFHASPTVTEALFRGGDMSALLLRDLREELFDSGGDEVEVSDRLAAGGGLFRVKLS